MKAWQRPEVPSLPGESRTPCLHDTASEALVETKTGDIARIYVCGITPYDATHIGHASTYITFDTLQRVWLDAGLEVSYAQNITDVDDPLLERAEQTGVEWRTLAAQQIELFREDMASLRVLPPDDYVAVTEVIDEIADAVQSLLDAGKAYTVPTADSAGDDIYFDIGSSTSASWRLGTVSNLDRATMTEYSRERGGDPDRAGKRDPLDPLLWRAARAGEPTWPSAVGAGRPGWHIECSVIALKQLGSDFTVQGGASDLIFPHHELSAGHAAALSGHPLARVYAHAGLVAYQGEKMSKSLGNLVLVSELRDRGVEPGVIRLAILTHHYRSEWEWTDDLIDTARDRLERWRRGFADRPASAATIGAESVRVLRELREALREDLDTPRVMTILDRAAITGLDDPALIRRAIDALLGVLL